MEVAGVGELAFSLVFTGMKASAKRTDFLQAIITFSVTRVTGKFFSFYSNMY